MGMDKKDKMEIIKCDRCGSEASRRRKRISLVFFDGVWQGMIWNDLCNDCLNEFRNAKKCVFDVQLWEFNEKK